MAKNSIRNEKVIEAFGKRVLELRTANGITQEVLAENAKISQVQVARIEAGSINTTLSTIYAVAVALNISPSELFDFDIKEK